MFLTVAYFDAPLINDCTVTAIPGAASSPLQVVASLPNPAEAIQFIDSTGKYIGVYMGGVGQEVLAGVIGGSATQVSLMKTIPKGSRVSLRSVGTSPITTGSLFCSFLINR